MFVPALLLLAIAEPCYGLETETHVEGRHLWLEHDSSLSNQGAVNLAAAADEAWDVYADELGWPVPPEPIALRADFSNDMASGQCITVECGGEHVPLCHVFKPAFDNGTQETTAHHEIGHAFQYAVMGSYLDALESWAWWMEGSATWITYHVSPNAAVYRSADNYIDNPQWGLHNDFAEVVTGTRGGHMYGTALLAFFIDQYYGGPDTMLALWEWGAEQGGEKIFFPEAIEGVGIDFDEFWPHYLATFAVLDLEIGPNLTQIPGHLVISELPGAGAPPESARPEGLGIGILRVPAGLGAPGMDLHVDVQADARVPWQGALARTDGAQPGSAVLEYVAAEFNEEGQASLVLSGFDGSSEAFLALSPESIDKVPFGYEVSARLEPAPVAETGSTGDGSTSDASATDPTSTGSGTTGGDAPAVAEDDTDGCGCRAAPRRSSWFMLLVLLAARRRCPARRRSHRCS